MLRMYGVQFKEDDSIPALFSKLLSAYDSVIEPVVVAGRIKSVLRSAGGIMNAINELRNNNSVAHPNEQLIKEREAKLEIRLVNAIVDYIEDIEKEMEEGAKG